MAIRTVNPFSEQIERELNEHTAAEIERMLSAAVSALPAWRTLGVTGRTAVIRAAGELLQQRRDEYARLMSREMGKTIRAARAEVEKCAWLCKYYVDNGAAFLAEETVETDATRSHVRFDPLGVVLAVMPWNFPFWQVMRFAVPALTAGNAALLKHASNVPQCALALEQLWRDAGAPQGIFHTLLIGASGVQAIIEDPRVRAATVTGSEGAGVAVATACARVVKKTVLELGGSDPFVVLSDADLEAAVDGAVSGRTVNAGQSCIAAKRFIVAASLAEEFTRRFSARMAQLRLGDPLDEQTDIGPLASADVLETIDEQVRDSVKQGARLVTGGRRPARPGFFYEPTVLAGVRPGMRVYEEETFGPVAAVIAVDSEEEAIRTANRTSFGLAASLWTRDAKRGERLAEEIEAGVVFVNDVVKSDPRLPFGGVKRSGYGRELSRYGLLEFVNIKSVWIA